MYKKLVDATVWGPHFWALLNTIVKFAHKYGEKYDEHIDMIINELPYVLPCSTCRGHCLYLYDRKMVGKLDTVNAKNMIEFIYILKTNVNTDIKKKNITYAEYEQLIENMKIISLERLFKLLNTISIFYMQPENNYSENKESLFYFVRSLIILTKKIPELNALYRYKKFELWESAKAFNKWLENIYFNLTNRSLPRFS